MNFEKDSSASLEVRNAMSLDERITRYLEVCPAAVSGQGGHNTTFYIACILVHGFNLPSETALGFLRHYNRKCEPPWSEQELRHKIADAAKVTHQKPRGYLLAARRYPLPAGRYETELPRPELCVGPELPRPELSISTEPPPWERN